MAADAWPCMSASALTRRDASWQRGMLEQFVPGMQPCCWSLAKLRRVMHVCKLLWDYISSLIVSVSECQVYYEFTLIHVACDVRVTFVLQGHGPVLA